DVVRCKQLRRRGLLSAERQQLARQRRRPPSRAQELLEIGTAARSRLELLLQELPIVGDDGEEVVEVVRDTAGEPAHRLELLRLAQLLFEHTVLGDIVYDADEAFGARIARPEADLFDHEIADRAVGADDTVVVMHLLVVAGIEREARGHERISIGGMDAVPPRAGDDLFRRPAEDRGEAGIAVHRVPGRVVEEASERRSLDEPAKARLAFAE